MPLGGFDGGERHDSAPAACALSNSRGRGVDQHAATGRHQLVRLLGGQPDTGALVRVAFAGSGPLVRHASLLSRVRYRS